MRREHASSGHTFSIGVNTPVDNFRTHFVSLVKSIAELIIYFQIVCTVAPLEIFVDKSYTTSVIDVNTTAVARC